MKMKNEDVEKADALLWKFEHNTKLRFFIGTPNVNFTFHFPDFSLQIQPDDKVIINKPDKITTDEISIFLLKKLLKVFDVLTNNISDLDSERFRILYRYAQFLLHKVAVIYPKTISMSSEYITNKEKRNAIKNTIEAKLLEISGSGSRYLIKKCAPIEATQELFNLFDKVVDQYPKRKGVKEINEVKRMFMFSESLGLFDFNNPATEPYKIKKERNGKPTGSFKLINHLCANKSIGTQKLRKLMDTKSSQDINKRINDINERFKRIFEEEENLITPINTGGYEINNLFKLQKKKGAQK